MAAVGLVSVLYNSNDVLEDFFKSLSIQTFKNYHLYLIDNSPSAATNQLQERLLKQYSIPGCTYVKNPENYGVAKGNNQGIKLALEDNSDYVLLLNNDIDFSQPFLLEEMVGHAIGQNEHLLIPKIYYHGTKKIWLAGGEFINYKGTSRTTGDKEEDVGQYDKAGYVNYAPTCFMLINKEVFGAVGLMDEKYFVYYDDDDFILRATRRGFKIYYLPQLQIFHKVSFSTGGSESLFSIYYLNRNRIYYIRKNFGFPMQQIAIAHATLTKGIRYLMYDKERRRQLLRAFKDGFAMKVD